MICLGCFQRFCLIGIAFGLYGIAIRRAVRVRRLNGLLILLRRAPETRQTSRRLWGGRKSILDLRCILLVAESAVVPRSPPLSHHAMFEAPSDVNQGAENHGIVRVGRNVVYEAAVDFQSIQWKFS